MQMLAPLGPVYQAGTLSGNPLAMRAGLATLPHLRAPNFYEDLNKKSQRLAEGLRKVFAEAKIPVQINAAGSLLTIFFNENPIHKLRRRQKIRHQKIRQILHTIC